MIPSLTSIPQRTRAIKLHIQRTTNKCWAVAGQSGSVSLLLRSTAWFWPLAYPAGCKRATDKEYVHFGTVPAHFHFSSKTVKGNYSDILLQVWQQQELEVLAGPLQMWQTKNLPLSDTLPTLPQQKPWKRIDFNQEKDPGHPHSCPQSFIRSHPLFMNHEKTLEDNI